MARKRGFERMLEEDGDAPSFYKILRETELLSESTRRIPKEFLRSLSGDDFTYRVVLKVEWGSSWSIPLSRIRGCIFMEQRGWEEFLRDNGLGRSEFLIFTHRGKMRLNVKIFTQDAMKVLEPPPPPPEPMIPSRDARRRDSAIKKEEPEHDEFSGIADLHGGGARRMHKGESAVQHTQADARESHMAPQRRLRVSHSSPECSSRGFPQFAIEIKRSYLTFLLVPRWFGEKYLPRHSMAMVIHDEMGRKWKMGYLYRETRMTLSAGWLRFARESGLKEGEWCTFELFNSHEMRIRVSKTKPTW